MPLPVPATLWFVRHGESAANVIRLAALHSDVDEVDIPYRDVDVPLSRRGERQATALGRWFADLPASERPTVVIASPYLRAARTAELIVAGGGTPDEVLYDERFREKELGLFHSLTRRGMETRYPDQWALRVQTGRFYYRPPGGESWCDVALRLRAALDEIRRDYAGERVLVVCHQIVIHCARYVLERLSERATVQISREHDVANCSVTSYRGAGTRLTLDLFNYTVPLREDGAPVTAEPNVSAAVSAG